VRNIYLKLSLAAVAMILLCVTSSFAPKPVAKNMRPMDSAIDISVLPDFLKPKPEEFEKTNKSSLSEALNPDGTLKEGMDGSFDPTGFNMRYGPNGEPVFSSMPFGEGDERWQSMPIFQGLNGGVNAIAINGDDIYVGGSFTDAGGIVNADRIAIWNGKHWSSLGAGIDNGIVNAIAISLSGTNIYIGGNFINAGGNSNANHIAVWNGTAWGNLGDGLSNPVHSIAIDGSDVFVGGREFYECWG
jgi:hypothetical protein